jgi:hypothetical protein
MQLYIYIYIHVYVYIYIYIYTHVCMQFNKYLLFRSLEYFTNTFEAFLPSPDIITILNFGESCYYFFSFFYSKSNSKVY